MKINNVIRYNTSEVVHICNADKNNKKSLEILEKYYYKYFLIIYNNLLKKLKSLKNKILYEQIIKNDLLNNYIYRIKNSEINNSTKEVLDSEITNIIEQFSEVISKDESLLNNVELSNDESLQNKIDQLVHIKEEFNQINNSYQNINSNLNIIKETKQNETINNKLQEVNQEKDEIITKYKEIINKVREIPYKPENNCINIDISTFNIDNIITSDINKQSGITNEDKYINKFISDNNIQESDIIDKNNELYEKQIIELLYNINEVNIHYDINIKGRIDLLLKNEVIEIKSRQKYFYKTIPKYEEYQIILYMYLTDIKRAQLVQGYLNNIKCNKYIYDEFKIKKIKSKIEKFTKLILDIIFFTDKYITENNTNILIIKYL